MTRRVRDPSPAPTFAPAPDAGPLPRGYRFPRLDPASTALAAGIILRLLLYVQDDSLWRDEAKVLLPLRDRDLGSILAAASGPPCPILLGMVFKLMMYLGLETGAWLRLPGMLAGLATLFMLPRLLRRFLPSDSLGHTLAIWLAAVTPGFIIASNLAKPFAMDIFLALVLVVVFLEAIDPIPGPANPVPAPPGLRRCLPFILLGWFAPGFSYPSILILGGLSLGFLARWRGRAVPCLAILWLGLAVAGPFLFRQSDTGRKHRQEFWAGSFAEPSPRWFLKACSSALVCGYESTYTLAYTRLGLPATLLLGPLTLAGFVCLVRSRDSTGICALLGPWGCGLAASAVHAYPFEERFLFYGLPGAVVLAGMGARSLTALPLCHRGLRMLGSLFIAIVLGRDLWMYGTPQPGMREAMEVVERDREPTDVVVVDVFGSSAFRYYRGMRRPGLLASLPDRQILFEWTDEATYRKRPHPAVTARRVPPGRRVWFLAEATGYQRHSRPRSVLRPSAALCRLVARKRSVMFTPDFPRATLVLLSADRRSGLVAGEKEPGRGDPPGEELEDRQRTQDPKPVDEAAGEADL